MADQVTGAAGEFGFKFAVGATLEHIAAAHRMVELTGQTDRYEPKPHLPVQFYVLERVLQQCPGGVQRHYMVRMVHPVGPGLSPVTGKPDIVQFNEIELREAAPFQPGDLSSKF